VARRWRVLLIATAGAFLANLDLFVVNIAFPAIGDDFPGASLSDLQWVLSAYAIVFAALLVPAGRLADLLGRKRLFLAGLGVFTLASALCAAAPGPWWLVAARVVQAVGAALMIPTSLALVVREFPPEKRAAAVGLWTAGAAVAATLGPTVGGLLVEWSWRGIFLINLPLAAVIAVAAVRQLEESRDPDRAQRPDLAGALLLVVAVGALALGIVEGGEWGWASAGVLGAWAVAVAAGAGFAVRSARHPAPVVEPGLLRAPGAAVADAGVFLFSMGFFALLLSTALFLTDVWDYSTLQAGIAFAPGPLMVALLSGPAGALAGRTGTRPLVIAGSLLFAAGNLWWIVRAGTEPGYVADVLPGMLLSGLGVALVFPILAGAAVSGLPPGRTATGSALFNTARQVGGVVGVAAFVAILGDDLALSGFRAGWMFMGASALAAGALALLLPGRAVRRRTAPAPPPPAADAPTPRRAPASATAAAPPPPPAAARPGTPPGTPAA
jgi:EmrB/QacA subfamily drug resistance transporter